MKKIAFHLHHILIICIIALGSAVGLQSYAAGVTPRGNDNPLAPTIEKLKKSPSLSVKFYYDAEQGKYPGSMVVSGNKYSFTAGNYMVWFDGKTMWTYLKNSREVTITEPTEEELLQSNPFEILAHSNTHYNIKRLTDRSDGLTRVSLTPKGTNDAGITRATVILSKENWPKKITLEFASGGTMVFEISSITEGRSLPISTFKYDGKKNPASETIDLR